MEYEIINSGSDGNCVVIEDMMFDVGVSYKKLKHALPHIKYIFVTHRHTDHIKPVTFKRISREYPRIKWIVNYNVAETFGVDYFHKMVGDKTSIKLKDRTIEAFQCVHDVPCSAFVITYNDGSNFIYATDTATLEYAPVRKYDKLFLESNHDEYKLEQALVQQKKYSYNAYSNGLRHLSTQKSKEFYYLRRKNRDSEWVELHKSSRFY